MRISDWRSCSNAPIKNERRVDESRRLRAWQTRCIRMSCTGLSQRSSKTRVAAKPAACLRRRATRRSGGADGSLLGLVGQLIRLVGAFPGEFGLSAPEVSIGGGLLVDRPHEVQHLAQPVRREVEMLADQLRQPLA